MDKIQGELEAAYPNLDIQLLGVNAFGHENGVPGATEDKSIPLLQDIDADANSRGDIWELWDVEWRDVVILDAENQPVAVYNLTEHDLFIPANYDTMKSMLLEAAATPAAESSVSGYVYFDTDNDGIRDSADSAISGVEIVLSGTDYLGQAVSLTTRSGADGSYAFEALAQGTYTVTETQPSLTIDGHETIGSHGGTVGNDRFEITLEEDMVAVDYNFAERGRSATGISLSDFFAATPRDGILIVSEPGNDPDWYCLEGTWKEYQSAEVSTSQPSVISVVVRDTENVDWHGDFPRDSVWQVHPMMRAGNKRIDRVRGLLASTSSAPNFFGADESGFHEAGEGEAASQLALSPIIATPIAEGEFNALTTTSISTPVSALLPILSNDQATVMPSFVAAAAVDVVTDTTPDAAGPILTGEALATATTHASQLVLAVPGDSTSQEPDRPLLDAADVDALFAGEQALSWSDRN